MADEFDSGIGVVDAPPTDISTDTSVDTSAEVDGQIADQIDGNESEQHDQTDPAAQTEKYDARTLPKAVKEALAGLKTTNPQVAKALNEAFFNRQELLKEIPEGLTAVREMKAAFDGVGGSEGLAQLQERSGLLDTIDTDIANGDPKVLDDIISGSPDGFKKLVPHIIDKLQALDGKAYGDALRPHFVSTLEGVGLDGVLDDLAAALKAGDGTAAMRVVNSFAKWFDGLKQQSSQARSTQPDPERQKFEKERTEFQSKKESDFRSDIGRQSNAHMSQVMEKNLNQYLKGKNLTQEAKADLAEGINGRVSALLKADKNYQTNVKSMLAAKNRDSAKINRYITAKLDTVVPTATKEVWERRYGKSAPPLAAVAAKTAAQPGQKAQSTSRVGGNQTAIQIAKKPSINDIDLTEDPKMLLFMTGKGVMKTGPNKGKLVRWPK